MSKVRKTIQDADGTIKAVCCQHCFDHSFPVPCEPCAIKNVKMRSALTMNEKAIPNQERAVPLPKLRMTNE